MSVQRVPGASQSLIPTLRKSMFPAGLARAVQEWGWPQRTQVPALSAPPAALVPPRAPPALAPVVQPPAMTQHVRDDALQVANGVLSPRHASFVSESTHGPTQAVVLALHGFSAGPWQMQEQMYRLNDAGFDMLGARMPGHGALQDNVMVSQDLPDAEHIQRYYDYANDAIAMAQDWAHRKHVPLIVFGYSLGGTTACHILSTQPHAADGLVVLAPLLGHTQIKFRLLHGVARALALSAWGRERLKNMAFSWGPHPPSPHWIGHWTCTASQTYAAVEFARQVGQQGGQWSIPTLGIVSDADLRCQSAATESFLHARNPQARVLRFGTEQNVGHAMLSPMENPNIRVRQEIGDQLIGFVRGVLRAKAEKT